MNKFKKIYITQKTEYNVYIFFLFEQVNLECFRDCVINGNIIHKNINLVVSCMEVFFNEHD